jgi:toxin-antitoxin system PIN domain toxin
VIALDTNVLVYAHRRDSDWHTPAAEAVRVLAESPAPWAIPWPCLHEFLAIVTHPRIYDPPTPLARALDQVDAWLESPSLVPLAEPRDFFATLRPLVEGAKAVGARVHDARVAALCLAHGVRELWTADRDFGRFPKLTTRNPLAR